MGRITYTVQILYFKKRKNSFWRRIFRQRSRRGKVLHLDCHFLTPSIFSPSSSFQTSVYLHSFAKSIHRMFYCLNGWQEYEVLPIFYYCEDQQGTKQTNHPLGHLPPGKLFNTPCYAHGVIF